VEDVWDAWTKRELLDQWWAPKPYKAVTKSMDFREGGKWLYTMVGPEGDRQNCRVDYMIVAPRTRFTCTAVFCDEQGQPTSDIPVMHWLKEFSATGDITTVYVTISFDNGEDMEKILSFGMAEGFTMALNNLDEFFAEREVTK
jgi:uncharacterized protein YndB with AHSA1/START domain